MAGLGSDQSYGSQPLSLDAIRDYVDIICTYNCKVCGYSSIIIQDMWHHVTESHLNLPTTLQNVNLSSGNEMKTGSTVDVNVAVTHCEVANDSCAVASNNVGKVCEAINSNEQVSSLLSGGLSADIITCWRTSNMNNSENDLQSSPEALLANINQNHIILADTVTKSISNCSEEQYGQPCPAGTSLPVLTEASGDTGMVVAFSGEELKGETVKEVFICSSCGTGYSNTGIIEHMVHSHGMQVEPIAARGAGSQNFAVECASILSSPLPVSEISPTPNVVSTGTQVQLVKKPGRKRKCDKGMLRVEAADSSSDVASVVKDEASKNAADEMRAVRALGIERLSGDGSNINSQLSKRQIHPPRMLVKDYHIIYHRHWKRHIAPATTALKFRCEVAGCGITFNSSDSLAYHAKCHVPNNESASKFACPECNRPFETWIKLQTHLQDGHGIAGDKYHCDTCDFNTETAVSLEEHNLAVHYGDLSQDKKRKTRNIGSKRSNHTVESKSESHDAHQVLSAAINECSSCKRTFASRKSLRKHIEVVHEKLKLFMCSICGYNSARKATLQLHMRIHTGEKPFRCDMCMFSASDHNTLRRHRMRHTGQRSYSCAFCSYTCIQAASLKLHIRSKHPDAPPVSDVPPPPLNSSSTATAVYTCTVCRYQTVNQRSYLSHVTSHGHGSSAGHQGAAVSIRFEESSNGAGEQRSTPTSQDNDSAAGCQDSLCVPSSQVDAAASCPVFSVVSGDGESADSSKVYTLISYVSLSS